MTTHVPDSPDGGEPSPAAAPHSPEAPLPPPAPPTRASLRARAAALHAAVLGAFGALSAFHTWPLVRDLGGHLIEKEDNYMNVWHVWWMRQALWEAPQNPFFSPLLHYPIGAELYWHTLSPAKSALGVPLLAFLSPETAHNLIVFLTFPMAAYAAWLLLRYLLSRAGASPGIAAAAALAGACAFAFSPYHYAQATAHMNLAAIEGIPVYLYFFLRYLDEGRRRLLWGVALSALYVTWCDYYYLLYAALFSALWVIADRWSRGPVLSLETFRDPGIRRAAAVAGAAALGTLPAVTPLLLHLKPEPIGIHHGDSDYFADVVGLVVPDPFSFWHAFMPERWGRIVVGLAHRFMGRNMEETGYFLGWGVPLLSVSAAWWSAAPHARRWLGIGASFLALSMGTMLYVAGDQRHTPVVLLAALAIAVAALPPRPARRWSRRDVGVALALCAAAGFAWPFTAFGRVFEMEIPLPYLVFKSVVPLFGRGGMPVRFQMMVTLVMAVLVAFVAAWIGARLGRRSAGAGVAAALLVALVPNAEYLRVPMPLRPAPELPPILEEIRRAPPHVAVATDTVMGQYEAAWHGKAVNVARQSRRPVKEHAFEGSPFMAFFAYHQCGRFPPEELQQLREFLHTHRIGYWIRHRPNPTCDAVVQHALGGTLAQTNGRDYWVFRFDEVLAAPPP